MLKTLNMTDGYQRGPASIVYKCFDKKSTGSSVNIPLEFNEKLAEELHKPIIRKFNIKEKFILDLKIIFRGADLADMQLINKLNKRFRFLQSFIDIFTKYAWVVPLKDKKSWYC